MKAKNGFKVCSNPKCSSKGEPMPLFEFGNGTSKIGGGKVARCKVCVAKAAKERAAKKEAKNAEATAEKIKAALFEIVCRECSLPKPPREYYDNKKTGEKRTQCKACAMRKTKVNALKREYEGLRSLVVSSLGKMDSIVEELYGIAWSGKYEGKKKERLV